MKLWVVTDAAAIKFKGLELSKDAPILEEVKEASSSYLIAGKIKY